MKIVVSGPASAFSVDTETQVTDAALLQKLDGLPFSKDRCSTYLDVSLQDIGIKGGLITLAFDEKTKKLRVITEYRAPRKLSAKELKQLVGETTGQWSDGIGEGEFLHRSKTKMDIDLSPMGSKKALAEQVDDGQKTKKPRVDALINALRDGKVSEAKRLIAEDAPVNGKDRYGATPLHRACLLGAVEIARLLVDRGANVNAADKSRQTPLASLAIGDVKPAAGVSIAGLLLEHGAAVDARDKEGITPLMWAVNRGKLRLVELLVEAGADVNAKDRSRYNESTVIMYAQRLDVIQVLLDHGADPSIRNASGDTAWEYALLNSHVRGYKQQAALLQSHARKKR